MKRISFASIAAGLLLFLGGSATAGNTNGVAGAMPALYDGKRFIINFMQLPPGGESATLSNNTSINTIYMCDSCGFMFISVLDAIQGDGFNPLWQEVQLEFNPGFAPHQFASDTDILAAEATGEITLTPTSEVYRCSVIGKR